MALTINTNTMSLNAQRNLSSSRDSLATSLQRLSSGLRINSAKDDAAGMAIATRMTTQINGHNQAQRNANDGVSLAQTTEGALQEVTNNLQRIRELAVQSANASNSASDRSALDNEVQQRLSEIERIASQTTFNGQHVLDGTFGTATFQVGANVGDTININLSQGVKSSQMGQIATLTSTAAAGVGQTALGGAGTIQVGSNAAVTVGISKQGTAVGQSAGSAYAKAVAIGSAAVPGLTATAVNNVEFTVAATSGVAAGDAYSLTINGQAIFASYDQNANGVLTAQQITDGINGQASVTGVTATLTGGNLRLSAADGRDINVGQTFAGPTPAAGGITAGAGGSTTVNGVTYRDGVLGTVAQATSFAANASTNSGTVTLSATDNIVVTGDGVNLGFANANTTIARDTTTLSSQNVQTVSAANSIIQRVDSALTTISALRSALGAIQSRFESVVTSLQTAAENLSSSRSRIQDADFAAETANLTRAQILQQAGTAILAQANSAPQSVLKLLQ
jgi:flagellin